MGRPKKPGGITPKMLVYLGGSPFTKTGGQLYRNWESPGLVALINT